MSRVVDERVDFDVLSIDSLDISVGLTLDPLGWTMDFISSPHPPFALSEHVGCDVIIVIVIAILLEFIALTGRVGLLILEYLGMK